MNIEKFFFKKEGDVVAFVVTAFLVVLTMVSRITPFLEGGVPMLLVGGLAIFLMTNFVVVYFLFARPLARLAVKAKYAFAKWRRIRAICRG